jgi:hypothetical protein
MRDLKFLLLGAVVGVLGCLILMSAFRFGGRENLNGRWQTDDGKTGFTFLPDGTVSQASSIDPGETFRGIIYPDGERRSWTGKYNHTGGNGILIEFGGGGERASMVYTYHVTAKTLNLTGPDGRGFVLTRVE